MEGQESSDGLYMKIGLWTANILAAIVIAYIFITMVMSATAQQDALSELKSQQVTMGFRSAFAMSEQAKAVEQRNASDLAGERAAQTALSPHEQRYHETERQFEDAWGAILPYATRLSQQNMCDIILPADGSLTTRANVLDSIRDCSAEAGAPTKSTRLLSSAQTREKQARSALDNQLAAFGEYYRLKLAHDAAQENVRNAAQLTPEQANIRKSFSDVDYMLDSPALLGPAFVPLPPTILQIALTFVAGTFGALLVTLILIVYPSKELDIEDWRQTWARTLLGGLIALCVYVVLLSGTAVLGSSNINSGAGTNYLAFCGIGILAGMFSDRVAAWLSERAGILFGPGAARNTAGGAGGGAGTGGTGGPGPGGGGGTGGGTAGGGAGTGGTGGGGGTGDGTSD